MRARLLQPDLSTVTGAFTVTAISKPRSRPACGPPACAIAFSRAADKAGAYAADVGNRVAETAGAYTSSLSEYADAAKRTLSEQAAAASDYAGEMGRTVSQRASAATDYAGELGRNISHQASELTGQASATVQSGFGYVMREQPLAIAVFGVAVGAALAALFPPTEIEAKTLGPAGEAIANRAAKVGEFLMGAAGEAGEQLKNRAAERGLNPEGLKEMAKEAVSTFASKAAGSGSESSAGSTTGGTANAGSANTGSSYGAAKPASTAGTTTQPGRGGR